MKKRFSVLLCIILVLTLCASCGGGDETPQNGPEDVSDVYPLEIEDQMGNKVTLEKEPERIVSGYYISSSACIALGLEDKLVGLEEKIDKRPIYNLAAPQLIGKAANIGSAKAFDLEACIGAEPDLVILPKKAKDYASALASEMGIPTIVVNPESHEQLEDMIRLIGKAAGVSERADAIIAEYDRLLGKVESITSKLEGDERPAVYMCGVSSYLRTAPKDMYQASLIAAAGGKNAADCIDGDSWVDISYEQILSMDPDIIIIPTNRMASGEPDFKAEDIYADAQLSEIKAVKNKAVYNMPSGYEAWDSPVPSGVLGVLWMTAILHPDMYSLSDFAKDAADFYRTFYGFELDPDSIIK